MTTYKLMGSNSVAASWGYDGDDRREIFQRSDHPEDYDGSFHQGSDRHPAGLGLHQHGRFAPHTHLNDNNHSKAQLADLDSAGSGDDGEDTEASDDQEEIGKRDDSHGGDRPDYSRFASERRGGRVTGRSDWAAGMWLQERCARLALRELGKSYDRCTGDEQRGLILKAMADPRTRMPSERPGRYVASADPDEIAKRLAYSVFGCRLNDLGHAEQFEVYSRAHKMAEKRNRDGGRA